MPLQRDQPRAREKPRTALSACQKVIVKNRKISASNFLQLLFILQSSSSKCMTTLMLTARQRNFQDLLFLVQRKGFGAGVIACLRTCVFLQLLLDLPRERTGKMGPADSALMILLRRLARPSAWVDLQGVLGGSRTALSRIFTHMLNLVWVRYGPLVSDIYIWKPFFADFAKHLEALGAHD